MSKQITYLIGAGASANKIPTVLEMSKDIIKVAEWLKTYNTASIQGKSPVSTMLFTDLLKMLIDEMMEIASHCDSSQSFDAYMKILFSTQQWRAYDRYKIVFSIYMTITQILSGDPDSRYSGLISKLLNNAGELDENLTILSWNYDTQFEKSYSIVANDDRMDNLCRKLNVFTRNSRKLFANDGFALVKLNGTAAYVDSQSERVGYFHKNLNAKLNDHLLLNLLYKYDFAREQNTSNSALFFAWETNDNNVDMVFRERVANRIKATDELVVIGYSFPKFNKQIDQFLFAAMTSLNKVWIQTRTPSDEAERVEELLNGRNNVIIKQVNNCDIFQVPY